MARRRPSGKAKLSNLLINRVVKLTTIDYPSGILFPVLETGGTIWPDSGLRRRKAWKQENWVAGWGQKRIDIGDSYSNLRFWYSTCHTYKPNEISGGGLRENPTTAISGAVLFYADFLSGANRNLHVAYGPITSTYYIRKKSGEAWVDYATSEMATQAPTDMVEVGGKLKVCYGSGKNVRMTSDDVSWADDTNGAGAVYQATHIAMHDQEYYSLGNTLYWGSGPFSKAIGGSESAITSIIPFGTNLFVGKEDGLWRVWKTSDTQLEAVPVMGSSVAKASTNYAKWGILGGRIYFSVMGQLASFDGSMVMIEPLPWVVDLSNINSVNALTVLEDCIIVGFTGWCLALSPELGDWHYVMRNASKTFQALWFTKVTSPPRLYYGFDTDATTTTAYTQFYSGLFQPYRFAAFSEHYASPFDAGDGTLAKYFLEEVMLCSGTAAGKTIQLAYNLDDGASYANAGAAITTTGYVTRSIAQAARNIGLKWTLATDDSTVTPILHSHELVFVERPVFRREFVLDLLCSGDLDTEEFQSIYTAAQYENALWSAAAQDTPITLTDRVDTADETDYTCFMTLVDNPALTEEGEVTGMLIRVHFIVP